MITNRQLLQPEKPQILKKTTQGVYFQQKMKISIAVTSLINNKYVIVEDFYYTGLKILEQLKKELKKNNNNDNFNDQRKFRSLFRDASHKLLLLVEKNQLVVKNSPSIGWLKLLYPKDTDFLISFPEIQGLNSSWQWYQKGIKIDILNLYLHPYFGVYFPTRFDHLQLFQGWLGKYNGNKKNAIEIGIGSGVLSFQMLQNGFNHIFAVDNNINAIIGAELESKRLNYENRLDLRYGDLFEGITCQSDLIVFNPPWIIAKHELKGIDKAIYYDNNLFPRFFEQAKQHLTNNGKLVILFSNFAQVVKSNDKHPILEELENNNHFKKELFLQKEVKSASKKTKRKSFRKSEKVELWVLTKICD